MIIALQNQKGGVGKTTLSISIAHALARKNPKSDVLLVDADPQQSSLNWSEVRENELPFSIMGLAKKSLYRDLPKISKNYSYVVIDGPPRVSELARSCIMSSDIVLMPCTPSPLDIWASKETSQLIEEASIFKENLKCCFAINRKIVNTAIGNDVVDALLKTGIKVLDAHISQRIVFAESIAVGLTPFEVDPKSKASQEIEALVNEILMWRI